MESNHNYGLSEKQLSNLNYSAWQKDTAMAIEVQAYAEKKRIDTEYAEERQKRLEDVKSRKTLQRSAFALSKEGKLLVIQETFGNPITDAIAFFPVTVAKCYWVEDIEHYILYVVIKTNAGKEINLFLRKDCLTVNYINKKFDASGLSFGFSRKKESEMRMMFVQYLLETAQNWLIALVPGWYFNTQKICFAYPEDMTWKEAAKNA